MIYTGVHFEFPPRGQRNELYALTAAALSPIGSPLAASVRFEGDEVFGVRLCIVIRDKDLGLVDIVNCRVIEVSERARDLSWSVCAAITL